MNAVWIIYCICHKYVFHWICTTEAAPRACLTTPNSLVAWYDGGSIDIASNRWYDKTRNGHHGIISGSDIGVFDGLNGTNITNELDLDNEPVVYGTISTGILFGSSYFIQPNHTVFNLCKYRDDINAVRARIVDNYVYNALYGHWMGMWLYQHMRFCLKHIIYITILKDYQVLDLRIDGWHKL